MQGTGIFGGSFNPIHNGHIALAKTLLNVTGLDEIWFMVSPQNPLKQQAGLLDDTTRLEMARTALTGEPQLAACDYEFYLTRPSYTWSTLQHLSHDYPDRRFTLIIGADNWKMFGRWYRHEDILRHHDVVIYPRHGSIVDQVEKFCPLPKGQAEAGQTEEGQAKPQILIYHTHSRRRFLIRGKGRILWRWGTYLAWLLKEKGFSVYHDRSVYDVREGKLDRNRAYTYALEGITKILEENPSIQVVIDLHRDGVKEGTRLVTEVNGKPTARIMFFNGLSQTPDGPVPYLENPNREDNLAFSLQLQLKAEAYYPGLPGKFI